MEEELAELRTMASELKEKIECTLCMEIPNKGPVPVCSNGHFICSQCLCRRKEDGHRNCATCRVPMGNINSLLATVVIENIQHKCAFEACEEIVHFKKYKKHQEQCEHRTVSCPGNCDKLLSFREVAGHTLQCPNMIFALSHSVGRFTIGFTTKGDHIGSDTKEYQDNSVDTKDSQEEKDNDSDGEKEGGVMEGKQDVVFPTNSIRFNLMTLFFKMKKRNNTYFLQVVMLGSKEQCDEYLAEISILDVVSQPVISSSSPPRPISMDQWGPCLTVTEETLSTIWWYSDEIKKNVFEVGVKICYKEDVQQGTAKKARVEESEDDEKEKENNMDNEDVSNDTKECQEKSVETNDSREESNNNSDGEKEGGVMESRSGEERLDG